MNLAKNPITELQRLSVLLAGAEQALNQSNPLWSETLGEASKWLDKAARNICAQGYFGCRGGATCVADHK